MYFCNEVLEHFLSDKKVGNNAVFQRSNGGDITGRSAQHPLRIKPYGRNHFLITGLANGHHRGLIENNAFVTHIDEGICGAKINREIPGKKTAYVFEHGVFESRAGA